MDSPGVRSLFPAAPLLPCVATRELRLAWGVIAVTLDVAFWRSLDEIAGLERRSIEAICDGITTGAPRLRAASLERALEAYAVQAIMRRGAPLH